MVSQLIVKSQIGKAWNSKTLWILQDSLSNYITQSTDLNLAKLISNVAKEVNLVAIKYSEKADNNGCLKLQEHNLYAGEIPKITSDTDFNKLLQAAIIPEMEEISCKLILKKIKKKLIYWKYNYGRIYALKLSIYTIALKDSEKNDVSFRDLHKAITESNDMSN